MNERMVTGMTSVTPMALPTSMKSRSPTSMPSTAMISCATFNSSFEDAAQGFGHVHVKDQKHVQILVLRLFRVVDDRGDAFGQVPDELVVGYALQAQGQGQTRLVFLQVELGQRRPDGALHVGILVDERLDHLQAVDRKRRLAGDVAGVAAGLDRVLRRLR